MATANGRLCMLYEYGVLGVSGFRIAGATPCVGVGLLKKDFGFLLESNWDM